MSNYFRTFSAPVAPTAPITVASGSITGQTNVRITTEAVFPNQVFVYDSTATTAGFGVAISQGEVLTLTLNSADSVLVRSDASGPHDVYVATW